MRVLFVHQNYPAQLGHLARHLQEKYGCETLFTTAWQGKQGWTPLLKYQPIQAASEKSHFYSRNFLNGASNALGVYQALHQHRKRTGFHPDIVLTHSGFGSTLLLRELFDCPVVALFEFFYRLNEPVDETDAQRLEDDYRRRKYFMNAMIMSDLYDCTAGYTPTYFQRSKFPVEYLPKLEVLFDGIDCSVFRPKAITDRRFLDRAIPADTKIVTYVSRGFESMRGFDVFIRTAKRIYAEYPNVLFICVGSDRVCYGGDLRRIEEKSFREHVLSREQPDLTKFWFPGMISTPDLVKLFSLSDVHIYFTRPFVLSWSLFNALACGAKVVSSATPPVMEVISHGYNGLLAPFEDETAHAANALEILRKPEEYASLGENGVATVRKKYSLLQTFPQFIRLLERVTGKTLKPRRQHTAFPQ